MSGKDCLCRGLDRREVRRDRRLRRAFEWPDGRKVRTCACGINPGADWSAPKTLHSRLDGIVSPFECYPIAFSSRLNLPMNLPKLPPADPNNVPSLSMPLSWGISDPDRFHQLMAEVIKLVAPGHFLADNLFTWCRNVSLLDDRPFRRAWSDNIRGDTDKATVWRRYVQACAAYHCVQLPGDFVECGVYAGTGVKTVMDYLGGRDFPKTFWAYDTFDYNPVEGRSFADQKDGMFDTVRTRFEGYGQVRLARGLLPGVLDAHCPQSIAYLHLDLNSAEHEIAVLERLFPLIVPGGILILDDYEWASVYRTQKLAEDAWFDARQYRVMPLPTGQGLVFKR